MCVHKTEHVKIKSATAYKLMVLDLKGKLRTTYRGCDEIYDIKYQYLSKYSGELGYHAYQFKDDAIQRANDIEPILPWRYEEAEGVSAIVVVRVKLKEITCIGLDATNLCIEGPPTYIANYQTIEEIIHQVPSGWRV